MKTSHARTLLIGANFLFLVLLGVSYFEDPYLLLHGGRSNSRAQSGEWSPLAIPAQKPFADYAREMTGRRLFQYGLRVEEEPTKKNVIEDYQFLGMSQGPNGPQGFLKNTVTNRMRTMVVGDTLGGYEVKEIQSQSMIFQKGMEQYELRR